MSIFSPRSDDFEFSKVSGVRFHKLKPKFFGNYLEGLNLEQILHNWFEKDKNHNNCTFSVFLDGKLAAPFTEYEMLKLKNGSQKISELQKSFRITNVQLFSPQIQRLVKEVFLKTQKVLTVNLYVTPHSEAQCFTLHSDPHDTFIYQLTGEKEWSFVADADGYKKFTPGTIPSPFEQKKLLDFEMKFNLVQSDVLQFERSICHMARNKLNVPSAHLTFALSAPTKRDFIMFLLQRKFGLNLREDYFSEFVLRPLEELKFSSEEFSKLLKDYEDECLKKELLALVEGIPYK